MAVVAPVLIVLALIVYNLMMFAAAAARFDRVAPDIVIAHGVAPVSGGDASVTDASAAIAAELERAMGPYSVEVEVVCEGGGDSGAGAMLSLVGSLRTYRCIMRYEPWPGGLTIAGVEMGAPEFLRHERPVIIDPWRPGVVA